MNVVERKFLKKVRLAAVAILATAALAAPAAAATPNDAWITTKAKLALLTTEGVNAGDVNVDTVNRQVTLHGIVSSSEEKQKAEESVGTVQGVAKVRNLLQVVPPSQENAVARSDEEIAKEVRSALARQSAPKSSTVTVQSVNKGVVLLKGRSDNLSEQLTAVQTARSVPGVRRVASEIQCSETIADSQYADRNMAPDNAKGTAKATKGTAKATAKSAGKAVSDAAKATGNAVGDAAHATGNALRDATGAAADMYTTSRVKIGLLANEETPALDINVDTRDGNVTLFGEVPTPAARTAAEAEARKVSGVKKVNNQLQVVASADQPEKTRIKDEQLARDVKQRLQENEALKNVTADAKNCVVRLTGRVPTGEERIEAMQVARATRGVCAVQDELRFQ